MRGRHLRRFALYVRGIIRSRPVPAETRAGAGLIRLRQLLGSRRVRPAGTRPEPGLGWNSASERLLMGVYRPLVVLGSTKPSVASAATMAGIRHGRQRVIVPLPFDKTRVAVCHLSRCGEKMAWTSWAGRGLGPLCTSPELIGRCRGHRCLRQRCCGCRRRWSGGGPEQNGEVRGHANGSDG